MKYKTDFFALSWFSTLRMDPVSVHSNTKKHR